MYQANAHTCKEHPGNSYAQACRLHSAGLAGRPLRGTLEDCGGLRVLTPETDLDGHMPQCPAYARHDTEFQFGINWDLQKARRKSPNDFGR